MGSGELRYEIAQNAYIKLVLHAQKHCSSAVNGVLLGRVSAQSDTVVEILDAVPLFHSHLGLLPNLEISLILVSFSLCSVQLTPLFAEGRLLMINR